MVHDKQWRFIFATFMIKARIHVLGCANGLNNRDSNGIRCYP